MPGSATRTTTEDGYHRDRAYSRSEPANLLFTRELPRRLATGVDEQVARRLREASEALTGARHPLPHERVAGR